MSSSRQVHPEPSDEEPIESPRTWTQRLQARRDTLLTSLDASLGCGAFRTLKKRRWVFSHKSAVISAWDWMLCLFVLYTAIYTPLQLVFPEEILWEGEEAFGILLDGLFMLDILIKLRTSYRDHGYDIIDRRKIRRNYLCGWFSLDLVSSFPLDTILKRSSIKITGGLDNLLTLFACLRILRIGRLVRKINSLSGANMLRVLQMMAGFVLGGHWLGLGWYAIAIKPLEQEPFDGTMWWWLEPDQRHGIRNVWARQNCALYWALTVMTNLKGVGTHETGGRMCLVSSPEARILVERWYTILVFICGAVFYSII